MEVLWMEQNNNSNKKTNREIDAAIAKAFLAHFLKENLLTVDELTFISKKLKISVDNIFFSRDVYNKETHHNE